MTVEISLLIVSVAVLVLVLFLIPTIIQLRKSAKRIEQVSTHLDQQLPAILENVSAITAALNNIVSNGQQQMETLGDAVQNAKLMVDDVVDFEKRLRSQIENPIVDTLTTVTALVKAVRAFLVIILDRR